jgi:hypothetical protein
MKIKRIVMSPEVSEKIKCKHGLDQIVAKNVLESVHYIEKVGGGNYMAKTAYPSSNWQIDLYKRKRG